MDNAIPVSVANTHSRIGLKSPETCVCLVGRKADQLILVEMSINMPLFALTVSRSPWL